jgi:hypothetical protein
LDLERWEGGAEQQEWLLPPTTERGVESGLAPRDGMRLCACMAAAVVVGSAWLGKSHTMLNEKVDPTPSALSTCTAPPPMAVTSRWVMTSPNPVPPYSLLWCTWLKLLNNFDNALGAMPMPVSFNLKRNTYRAADDDEDEGDDVGAGATAVGATGAQQLAMPMGARFGNCCAYNRRGDDVILGEAVAEGGARATDEQQDMDAIVTATCGGGTRSRISGKGSSSDGCGGSNSPLTCKSTDPPLLVNLMA